MVNSRVPNDIVVGKGSLLMGCDIMVRGGDLLLCQHIGEYMRSSFYGGICPNVM